VVTAENLFTTAILNELRKMVKTDSDKPVGLPAWEAIAGRLPG